MCDSFSFGFVSLPPPFTGVTDKGLLLVLLPLLTAELGEPDDVDEVVVEEDEEVEEEEESADLPKENGQYSPVLVELLLLLFLTFFVETPELAP
jgi:hypothetical protein